MKKILALAFLYIFAQTIHAQSKIAYFDLNYAIVLLPEYKKAETEMEAYSKQLEAELKKKKEEFEFKYKDFSEAMQKGDVSETIAMAKREELQSLDKQYQTLQQSIPNDIETRKGKLLSPVYEKIEKTVQEVAQANTYTHVFRVESTYVPVKANNISDLVLKKLGITLPVTPEPKK